MQISFNFFAKRHPNYVGGERLSFQEIILLLTFIGSCIYATVSLTLKVLEFLLKNKKSR